MVCWILHMVRRYLMGERQRNEHQVKALGLRPMRVVSQTDFGEFFLVLSILMIRNRYLFYCLSLWCPFCVWIAFIERGIVLTHHFKIEIVWLIDASRRMMCRSGAFRGIGCPDRRTDYQRPLLLSHYYPGIGWALWGCCKALFGWCRAQIKNQFE